MKKIISVVGARPNFMKVAPLHYEFLKHTDRIQHLICHTGQHFDEKMSKIFFDELELPEPDFYLGVGSGSHAEQTARIMLAFEKVLLTENPDLVIVVGDVNSTMACSIVASKLSVKVAHVEAGLRSFDRTMPEELNRLVTDVLADYLFVSEKSGLRNLKNEGISNDKIFFVGNVMIDSLVRFTSKIDRSEILKSLDLENSGYVLVTFHRPSNVDSFESLKALTNLLNRIAILRKVVFPVHPRTHKNLMNYNLADIFNPNIIITEPIGYIDFQKLTKHAELIITDSGGIQEETTYLGVQCITVRDSTERPITAEVGTNQLIGADFQKVETTALEVLNGNIKNGNIPELWDGKTAERIIHTILEKI
ncbi:MAG: UDP-N-acetylglucosamine 2-epimerase (non-hydrolyzing) [Bacteroidia bacterium]|nr:UDP-N-acetylglucosamine 2-epimerase (non-hydrolyzing) [Bacteroidia bacterium]